VKLKFKLNVNCLVAKCHSFRFIVFCTWYGNLNCPLKILLYSKNWSTKELLFQFSIGLFSSMNMSCLGFGTNFGIVDSFWNKFQDRGQLSEQISESQAAFGTIFRVLFSTQAFLKNHNDFTSLLFLPPEPLKLLKSRVWYYTAVIKERQKVFHSTNICTL
jgi:hypothetical protein